jgi:competence protein ComEC
MWRLVRGRPIGRALLRVGDGPGQSPARSRATWLASFLLLAAALASAAQPATSRTDLLRVSFMDVGQGDGIWIQAPKRADGKPGVNVLIDGGPNGSKDENHLLDYLTKYNLTPGATIDYIVATHPHDDHYPGLTTILAQYEVKNIIDAGFPKDEGSPSKRTSYGQFIAAARKEKAAGKPATFVRLHEKAEGSVELEWGDDSAASDVPVINAEIVAGFWKGAHELGNKQNTKENNCSTVIRMTFGNVSFLFMGDGEGKNRADAPGTPRFVEDLLLKKYAADLSKLHATVLKVGHHGSETSSTLPFIRAVRPDVLVVTSGRKKFGSVFLPDATVLARYKKAFPNITIVRTDKDDEKDRLDTTNDADGDDIYVYTDGMSLRVFQAALVNSRWRWVSVANVQPDKGTTP